MKKRDREDLTTLLFGIQSLDAYHKSQIKVTDIVLSLAILKMVLVASQLYDVFEIFLPVTLACQEENFCRAVSKNWLLRTENEKREQ